MTPRNPYAAAVVALLLPACSLMHQSMVPGIENELLTPVDKVPPVSAVIQEIRAQLARAFRVIDSRVQAEQAAKNVAEGLTPQEGEGTFTGTTQLVETDSGNIAAVFPFSGYAGSSLTPNFGVSKAATSSQQTKIDFSFVPAELANMPASETKDGYVARALVATFDQLLAVPNVSAKGLANRTVETTITFAVALNGSAGLGVSLLPSTDMRSPSRDLRTVGGDPLLGTSARQMGTYELTLEIPLIRPKTSDDRRIYEGRVRFDGAVYLEERPWTSADDSRMRSAFSVPGPVVPFRTVDDAPALLQRYGERRY
ncbi:MAG: hypothetical protein KDE27_06150 [Planctomycetes bacterium]|nr:hypothetical protein [Planctomycetota bacterium]